MLNERQNLSNSSQTSDSFSQNSGHNFNHSTVSYKKTNKLITALYMVTDIMDTTEPIRSKLRALGVEIVSDMNISTQNNIGQINKVLIGRVDEILSFLGIASAMNMISEMNKNILVREFTQLKNSVMSVKEQSVLSLEDFFGTEDEVDSIESGFESTISKEKDHFVMDNSVPQIKPDRRQESLRIGVQKGHTLLKAISDRMPAKNSNQNFLNKTPIIKKTSPEGGQNFDMLKKERRFEIVRIIRDMPTVAGLKSATIKDIKDHSRGVLNSCGEKTLQRELVAMVMDGVLKKTGDKRWSKYSL